MPDQQPVVHLTAWNTQIEDSSLLGAPIYVRDIHLGLDDLERQAEHVLGAAEYARFHKQAARAEDLYAIGDLLTSLAELGRGYLSQAQAESRLLAGRAPAAPAPDAPPPAHLQTSG